MSTVGDLKTDVRAWTARDDLTDEVFAAALRALESELARKVRVRAMESSDTLTATAATVALPSDFLEAISITRDQENARAMRFTTATRIRAHPYRDLDGQPILVAIEGDNLVLYPTPTASGPVTINLIYFARFTALDATDNTDTNWLTANVHDLMFYGLMKHLGAYLRDKGLEAENTAKFEEALESLVESDVWSRFAGEPLEALGPVWDD